MREAIYNTSDRDFVIFATKSAGVPHISASVIFNGINYTKLVKYLRILKINTTIFECLKVLKEKSM